MNKRGKTNKLNIVIGLVALLIVGFVVFAGYEMTKTQGLNIINPNQNQNQNQNQPVGLYGNPSTFDVSALDKATTTSIGSTYILKYNSVDMGTRTSGTPVTVTPNQAYDILVSNASYYKKEMSGTAPLQPQVVIQPLMAKNGTLTFSVINSNGATVNANSTAPQAIGSGAAVTTKIIMTENGADAYWSNPDIGYFGFGLDWNTTEFSKSKSVLRVDGVSATLDNVPNRLAGTVEVAWKVPTTLFNSEVKNAELTLAAKTSIDPIGGTTGVDGGTRIVYHVWDADYYQNSVTGAFASGYETNLDADVGAADQIGYIYYS